jgi:hypothetical protein
MGIFRLAGRAGSSLVKRHEQKKKNEQLASDYEALVSEPAQFNKDIYLFLRPLALGESFRFANVSDGRTNERILFEEVLSRALDQAGQRSTVCVGDGGERWGAAVIDFEDDWIKKIVPLFKRARAIISIPGYTAACLKESYLIRHTPELLRKTVFVVPPLACFQPPLLRASIDCGIVDFAARVSRAHHEKIGLRLPSAAEQDGVFATFDDSGQIKSSMPWQKLRRRHTHRSSFGGSSVRESSEPYLSPERLIAAIRMAL